LNTYGNITNLVNNQISFNTAKITSLQTGLGALVDANEAQESATLQALQVQQQLATSALSIAEQTPSLLTKLIQ
jgi:flagellin